jgi:hypothetical protein
MLRITLPTAKNPGVYVLEGRLTGLWARELIRVVRAANDNNVGIFDLREVFYVYSAGEETLRVLSRLGARFVTESAYGKNLCKRLKLHRVTASYITDSRERLGATSKLRHGIGTEGAPSIHSAAQQLANTRDAESEG